MTTPSLSDGRRMTLAAFGAMICIPMFFLEREVLDSLSLFAIGVAVIGLFYYLFLAFASHKDIFFSSFYQIYFMIGLLISAVSVSGGAYMIEIGAFGDANGSFWILLGFFLAGMEATFFGFQTRLLSRISWHTPSLGWPVSRLYFICITMMVIFIGTYVVVAIGSPLLIGVDRVTFWESFAPSYLSFFPSLVIQTYFIACYYFLMSKRRGYLSILSIFVLAAYALITVVVLGQKFSAFVVFANAWLMVMAGAFPYVKIRPAHVIVAMFSFFLIIAFVVWSYIEYGYGSSFIFSRIALQAQLVWSVLSDKYDFAALAGSNWQCYFGCVGIESGQYYIAAKYLPKGLYDFYYEGGTTLSGFMPALAILSFGLIPAFALHVTISFMAGVLQREVCGAIRKDNVIVAFLLQKMQLGLVLGWYASLNTAFVGVLAAAAILTLYLMMFGTGRRMEGAHLAVDGSR